MYMYKNFQPVPVVAWSKAWVYGRSLAGTVGSNPAGGIGVSCECRVLPGIEVSAKSRSLLQSADCGVI